jgi:hypothetical protein
MRLWLACLLLVAAPALAGPPATIVVAPAGECAGEERDLVLPPLPGREDSEAFVLVPGVLHLSPKQVASGPPRALIPPPAASPFEGPGPCDEPGSGCALEKLIDDPDPGSGCGFPGSPCP